MSPHNDPSNSGNRKEEAADDMELDVTFELGVVKMKKMIGKTMLTLMGLSRPGSLHLR